MKVLVTGVTGFVGGRIASRLAEAGHQVVGFVRESARWTDAPDGAETITGDITHRASVLHAAEGCDVIVHAAAFVRIWARDSRQFDAVNVQGLGHVVEAARLSSARVVYLSSFIALGPTDGSVHDEDSPRVDTNFHNDYERTKWVADQMARKLPAGDPPMVRLYPGVVYGPGAMTQGNHVVGLLLQHARGKLPGMLGKGDLRQCFAFVDDVVQGAVHVVENDPPEGAYILGGENGTGYDLFDAFERASGVAPPRRRIPFAVAAWIGRLQRWRGQLLGIEPELTDEVVGIYRHEWAFSSARAERDLGYRVTSLEDGVRQTVEWLRRAGEL